MDELVQNTQQAAAPRGTRIWNDQSHKSYRPLTVLAFRFQRILGARVFDSERALHSFKKYPLPAKLVAVLHACRGLQLDCREMPGR